MMGRQTVDQRQLFYFFNLEKRVPERHLLRRINPIVGRIPLQHPRAANSSDATC